jgi:hypothetical protein
MAQVFSEGFDSYASTTEMFASRFTSGYAVQGGTISLAATGSNFSTQCLNYFNSGSAANVYVNFNAAVNGSATKLCVGFWYKHTAVAVAQNLFVVTATTSTGVLGSPYTLININASGYPIIFMPTVAGGATSTTILADNKWHWVEAAWDINYAQGGTGFGRLYLDGVLVATTSSSATNANISPPTAFRFVMQANSSNQCWLDDISIWDNAGTGMNATPLGLQRIGTMYPSSDASTQFTKTGSAASNAATVNSSWSNSANYISAAAGATDLYQTTAPTGGNVLGLSTIHRGYAASATAASFNPVLQFSGTIASGTQVNLTTTPVIVQQFWPTDPIGNPWTNKTLTILRLGQTAT